MKIGIVFYSYSGNTKRACLFLEEKIKAKNLPVNLIDLRPKQEEQSFLLQCKAAFYKTRISLQNEMFNPGEYDFIIFASPVWAFSFTPALRTCLESLKDLADKKCACFLTYGSGLGRGKALRTLEAVLKTKSARILFSKNLSGLKTKNKEYLEEQFKSLIDIISA